MDYKGITTFKSVASKFLHRTQRPLSDYKRAVALAIDGYRDIHLFSLGNVKKHKQVINDIGCIDIPDDYQMFVSLSLPFNGREWTLTKDNRLISPDAELDGVETFTDDSEVSEDIHGFYSRSGENQYYYKIEEHNRRIIINGIPRIEVTLTYVSTGISMTEETAIPKYAEEALIAFINWKFAENENIFSNSTRYSTPLQTVMYRKNEYLEALRQIDFIHASTVDQIYDAIYESWTQTPKR